MHKPNIEWLRLPNDERDAKHSRTQSPQMCRDHVFPCLLYTQGEALPNAPLHLNVGFSPLGTQALCNQRVVFWKRLSNDVVHGRLSNHA